MLDRAASAPRTTPERLYYACEEEGCPERMFPASKYNPDKRLKYCTQPGHENKKMNREVRP
jgi:hypothetical protein